MSASQRFGPSASDNHLGDMVQTTRSGLSDVAVTGREASQSWASDAGSIMSAPEPYDTAQGDSGTLEQFVVSLLDCLSKTLTHEAYHWCLAWSWSITQIGAMSFMHDLTCSALPVLTEVQEGTRGCACHRSICSHQASCLASHV